MLYSQMSKEQLQAEKTALEKQYADYKAKGLKLDMSRGKPAPEQLNLSLDMLLHCLDGAKVRNEHVHAQMFITWKHEAAINHHHTLGRFPELAVQTDLTKSPQGGNRQFCIRHILFLYSSSLKQIRVVLAHSQIQFRQGFQIITSR